MMLFQAHKGKFLVGAIDFGTTYSGWAYSFLHDYQSNPTNAVVTHWYSGTDTLATEKTPTCALIAPDGKTLVGFGYEAENKYQNFVENDTHKKYYFFKRFKMALDKLVRYMYSFFSSFLCFHQLIDDKNDFSKFMLIL